MSYTLNWFVTQKKSTFPAIKYNSGNIFKMSKNNVNKENRTDDTDPSVSFEKGDTPPQLLRQAEVDCSRTGGHSISMGLSERRPVQWLAYTYTLP